MLEQEMGSTMKQMDGQMSESLLLGALLALALDTAFSRMMDTNDLPQMRRI